MCHSVPCHPIQSRALLFYVIIIVLMRIDDMICFGDVHFVVRDIYNMFVSVSVCVLCVLCVRDVVCMCVCV